MRSMRRLRPFAFTILLAIALAPVISAFAISTSSLAAGRFPYAAAVDADDAKFRSGPGESFYPTGDAQRGDAVEVYHEDGGWSAVRPPVGSHSWVASKLLKLPATLRVQQDVDLKSPVAVEVAVDNTPAFIGSSVATDRDAVAVRLNSGERVWVLSAEQAGGQTWIKIAPPSGEFRWIETSLLHATPRTDDSATDEIARDETPNQDGTVSSATDTGADADAEVATLAAAEESSDEGASDADGGAAKLTAAPPVRQSSPRTEASAARATTTSPARRFWTQLQALELELSMKVAGEPRRWQFDAIRRDAQNLYDAATSDEEYDAARYLLGKLAQFESVRRQRLDIEDRIARREAASNAVGENATPAAVDPTRPRASLAGPPPRPGVGSTANANAANDSPPESLPAASSPDDRYDASGRLVAIPTAGEGAPPYAIVDDRNIVRQYISPAPRVNLQPYVGRTIGITGIASPSPDATRPHVMAKRIDLLDGPVRR